MRQQRIKALGHGCAMKDTIEAGGAVTHTEDHFEACGAIGRRLVEIDTQLFAGMSLERLATARLTGLRAADLDGSLARLVGTEVVIKGHHAVYFGTRQVERLSNPPDGVLRDVAQGILYGVQDDNERSWFMCVAGDGGFNSLQFRGVGAGHSATPCWAWQWRS